MRTTMGVELLNYTYLSLPNVFLIYSTVPTRFQL